MFVSSVVWIYSSHATHLYDDIRYRNYSSEIIIILKNIMVQFLSIIIMSFIINDLSGQRKLIIIFIPSLTFILMIQKLLIRLVIVNLRQKGKNVKRVIIIGAGKVGRELNYLLLQNKNLGYHIIGFLDDNEICDLSIKYLGNISKLSDIIKNHYIHEVIIALPNRAQNKISEIIDICENNAIQVKIIPDFFKYLSDRYEIYQYGRFPIITVRNERITEFHSRIIKRIFDIFFSISIGIIFLSWVIPLISILVKISSKGPIFFKSERWGQRGQRFIMYKFRTMIDGSSTVDENGKHFQAKIDDPRFTKVGKILRKTNLDELPQLWNVICGEMSIVGPRPHSTRLNIESKEIINHYMMRYLVKPGITGWAQVNGLRGETKDHQLMQKRIDYDLWYIENWSLWLDVQIILMTLSRMIRGDPNAY